MNLLDALCAYLATIPGVGTYNPTGSGGTIFYPQLPDSAAPNPAACLALRPYGGQPPGPRTFEDGVPLWDAPLIQVVARDPDYNTAYARAQAAYTALAAVSGQLFAGRYCYRITCLQPPNAALGREQGSNYWLVSFNVAVVNSTR